MPIRTVSLSHLEMELVKTLNECSASGDTVVVEMPDHRLFAIQPLDPQGEDTLIDDLWHQTHNSKHCWQNQR